MQDKYDALKKYYGYDSFRPGQEQIIDNILAGRDIMAVMPTGAGKSICYQVPAVLLPGITLVISPLISLMRDQVSSLNSNGIPAAFLNSSLTARQYALALQRASAGAYKIIYVAPERLVTEGFRSFASGADISLLAVDEAHCVSQWGHDFRRSYTEIAGFVSTLKKRPVVAAFTATATEQVKADVKSLLGLRRPFEVTTGFDRPNLYFGVLSEKDKLGFIRSYLDKNPGRSGIIYAMTRKNVEQICSELQAGGYQVTMYHAGLSDEERSAAQDDFIKDKKPVMIATNAFGMGIDKPDVGFIIHFNMPLSMEAYYQEAGRAGRDGSDAECLLLYSKSDIRTAKFLIENGSDSDSADPEDAAAAKKNRLEKLKSMISYCESEGCLRRFILRYFGEKYDSAECGKCSSCLSEHTTVDVTRELRAVYIAVGSTGERFGAAFITDFLRGDDSPRMISGGYCEREGFAALSDRSRSFVRDFISRLVENGLLISSEGAYPILSISPLFDRVIDSGKRVTMRFREEQISGRAPKHQTRAHTAPDSPIDAGLFERLRSWRRDTAARRSVPAYTVCTDSTLRRIVAQKPRTRSELGQISGIGDAFISRYADQVLALLREYRG